MAILRGGGAGGRELQAPDGLDLAGPARDERRRVVVEVRAEIPTALCRGDRVEARTSRPHHGSPLTRPSRGIGTTSVASAAGFIPAATLSSSHQDVATSGYLTDPNHIPEGEQRLRRSRTRDERKPYGFPFVRYPPQSGNRRSCSTRRAPGAYAVLK